MSQANPATRVCGARHKARLPGSDPGTVCAPCQRAVFGQRELSDPDGRNDPAALVRDTVPMRRALTRLEFPAVPVICRSAIRLPRREPGKRTGLPESAIWQFKSGEQRDIYGIRQLLRFPDSVEMPRPALLPVMPGEPRVLGDLLAESASAASLAVHAGGAGDGG